jgi:hypothetical protein
MATPIETFIVKYNDTAGWIDIYADGDVYGAIASIAGLNAVHHMGGDWWYATVSPRFSPEDLQAEIKAVLAKAQEVQP